MPSDTGPTLFVEPGHFYSPIPSVDESEFAIYNRNQSLLRPLPGIHLDMTAMLERWHEMQVPMASAPFPSTKQDAFRYYYENDFYSYGDGLVFYSMLSVFRPRRVIEIGSGFSSALLLDTIDHLELETEATFIEPYPTQLYACLRPDDPGRSKLIVSKIQGVDAALFSSLEAGDMLFIDSSHVAKTGSDLTVELFGILPHLKPGVLVHFHDIFVGFEYPDPWILKDNRAWNECYFLRAFLMYNQNYEILFFNSHFAAFEPDAVSSSDTLFKKNAGGALWLRRTGA